MRRQRRHRRGARRLAHARTRAACRSRPASPRVARRRRAHRSAARRRARRSRAPRGPASRHRTSAELAVPPLGAERESPCTPRARRGSRARDTPFAEIEERITARWYRSPGPAGWQSSFQFASGSRSWLVSKRPTRRPWLLRGRARALRRARVRREHAVGVGLGDDPGVRRHAALRRRWARWRSGEAARCRSGSSATSPSTGGRCSGCGPCASSSGPSASSSRS